MKFIVPLILALFFAPAFPDAAPAQSTNSLFSITPSTGFILPNPARRGDGFGPPAGQAPPAQSPLPVPNAAAPSSPPVANAPAARTPAGHVALSLSAHFGKDAPTIGGGLTWRVYAAKTEANGNFM